MKKFAPLFIFIFFLHSNAFAQNEFLKDDSLISLLKNKYNTLSKNRIYITVELMNHHLPDEPIFDSIKNKLIDEAENSRDRVLMCTMYNLLAKSYFSYYGRQDLYEKGKPYADKCLHLANESGLDDFKVASYLLYARYYLDVTEKQKALEYNNQAIALATSLGNDSILCNAYSSIAVTWSALSNKLSKLQSLLSAREFAERSGIHDLIVQNYIELAAFYNEAEQYEKCKDYFVQAITKARDWNQLSLLFNAAKGLAQTYISANEKEQGLAYYNKALLLADSFALPMYKIGVYLDLLNYYFNYETPEKGLAYLKSKPELMKFLVNFKIVYQLNKLYAADKSNKKEYDSAIYYMNVAAPEEYGQTKNYGEKYQFSMQWAGILKQMGNHQASLQKFLEAKNYADSAGDFDRLKDVSLQLDSVYQKLNDYKNAFYYYNLYNFYRDTLDALGKQKDLLNVEIENTNKRAEQQKIADEALLRQRDNLQYMGITASIATIFIVLVLFGVFKMSPTIIKALGFFAFIFLFEFIILLLDTQIHEITHGEPWKVLGIKIIIIAMLLPLHHWLEEKVLHYLTSKAHKLKPGFNFLHRKASEETHTK